MTVQNKTILIKTNYEWHKDNFVDFKKILNKTESYKKKKKQETRSYFSVI